MAESGVIERGISLTSTSLLQKHFVEHVENMRPARVAAPRPRWKPPPAAGGGEEDPPETTSAAGRAGIRKKGAAGVRVWLAVDAAGQGQVVEAGKHAVMRRTGLPARDLRVLDPQLSYPSTLLGRERAVVVNLEHIKAVVTAHEVLLLNHRDPLVAPFVRELQSRLFRHHHRQLLGSNDQQCRHGSNEEWRNVSNLEEPKLGTASPPHDSGDLSYSRTLRTHPGADEKGKGEAISSHGPTVLPFEFVALEACLEATCSCLDNEVTTLEKEAYPALDKLTSKISTLNLEHVRQIKSRIVAISGRVQKVRDELEHLLDDDDDMAEMYLTEKLMQQHYENASRSSLNDHGDAMDEDRAHAEISSEENDVRDSNEDEQNIENHGQSSSEPSHFNGDSHITHTCSTRSSGKHLDVEELEMLLEAYFIQIDNTLNKLSTLREYVDDTEDYINIMLDDKQNLLLQMGVVLTTATLIVSAFVVIVAIFGMNIKVDLFDEEKSGLPEFLWIVAGGATGSLFLYVLAVAWCKRRRLLD